MTRRPKRAKAPVDEFKVTVAKLCTRWLYSPECYKTLSEDLSKLIKSDKPLDPTTRQFIDQEMRQRAKRGSRKDWRQRQDLAASMLKQWFLKAGMTPGDAERAVADELGISVAALRKRVGRGLAGASDVKIWPYPKELYNMVMSHVAAMIFPAPPFSDGQTHTANGRDYVYDQTINAWRLVGASGGGTGETDYPGRRDRPGWTMFKIR
jgi:hypothetical protein